MNNKDGRVLAAYRKLLLRYGKQRWWPAESAYEMAVGAVLTQNTSWKNVEKAIVNLKQRGLLKPNKMLETENTELENLVRPAGFFRQKAGYLKAMTRTYLRLEGMAGQDKCGLEMRGILLETRGIGPETADSILLYAFGKPFFVVDAYTRRFCREQFGLEFLDYERCRRFFERNLPRNVEIYNEYHALIVEWGKQNKKKEYVRKRKSAS